MTDSSHPRESNDDTVATYSIILLDADNEEHVLDEVSGGGYHVVNLPSEVALGVGYVWVQATFRNVDSIYQDRVPVKVIDP